MSEKRKKTKYTRCKRCKELVIDAVNCANCAARAEAPYTGRRTFLDGKRGAPTLDTQEGNDEWRGS